MISFVSHFQLLYLCLIDFCLAFVLCSGVEVEVTAGAGAGAEAHCRE